MPKYFIVLIFIAFFLGCTSNDDIDDETLLPKDDINTPEIIINGLDKGAVIETLTSIEFTITDESNKVVSRIFMDGEEIARKEIKHFSIELDPFDFSNGERVLRIESIDSSNNKSVLSKSFELKKLLFVHSDIQLPGLLGASNAEYFISVNAMGGALINYTKIEGNQENRFYAPDGFERQNFVATLYSISTDLANRGSSIISYADLLPGTTTLSTDQTALRRIENSRTDSFELTMSDASDITNFLMKGSEYSLGVFGNAIGNFTSDVGFDSKLEDSMFIYSNPTEASTLQNYRYLFIDNFTKTEISFNDFNRSSEFVTLEFPSSVTDYHFSFSAYRNQQEYDQNKFINIFRASSSERQDYTGFMDVPIFEEFEMYQKNFSATLSNSVRYYLKSNGLSKISVPNWTADLIGKTVMTSGDYSNMYISSTFRGTFDGNTVNRIDWFFHRKNISQFEMPFENFEIPDAVKNMLESARINPNNMEQLETLYLTLEHFEKSYVYEDGVFVGYGNSNYYGDERTMVFTIDDGIGN